MILEFLRSGNLGSLHLGLSRTEVRALLGQPSDCSERTRKKEIWKYDSLELTFIDEALYLLGLYFSNGVLTLPETLLKEGRIAIEKPSIQGVEKLVTDMGLHFAVVEDLTFDDQRVIRVEESDVSIAFFENELASFQLTQR